MNDKDKKQSDENEEKDPFSDEEEFKKMLNSMIESQTGQKGNARVIMFGNKIYKNIFLDFVVILIINLFLFLGIEGLFKVYHYEKLIHYLLYIASFTIIEYIAKYIMYRYFLPLVLKTLGMINLLMTVISIGICLYGAYGLFNFGIDSTPKFVITFIVILILRNFITSELRIRKFKR